MRRDKTETIDGNRFDTVANQIARNGDTARRLVVKIDVEGAEWTRCMATPDAVLEPDRADADGAARRGRARFLELVRRLKTRFYLVNLHFNNFGCNPESAPMPSRAYQVLWVPQARGRGR